MKIYSIAEKYILAKVIKEDPRIMEAAKRIVDKGHMTDEIIDEYHFNPTQIEDLQDAVEDLRKMKTLPVENILKIFDEVMAGSNRTIKNVERKSGIPVDDIVWIVRRFRPQSSVHLTPTEIQKIIELKEKGLDLERIVGKTRVEKSTIRNALLKHRPDLIKSIRSSDFWNKIADEYLSLVKDTGASYLDAVNILIKKYLLKKQELGDALRNRGIRSPSPSKQITPDEEKLIMEKTYEGKKIKEIAKDVGRDDSVVRHVIRRLDKDFYDKNFKQRLISPAGIYIVLDLAKKGRSGPEIAAEIKQKLDLNINLPSIYAIIRRYRPNQETKTHIEPETTEHFPEFTEPEDTVPFGGMQVRTMSPEEFEKNRHKFLTKQDIEERQRQKIRRESPQTQETQVASALSWYKKSQISS